MTKEDRDMLIRIDENVKQMHLALYGNGNPEKGMSRRFDKVESNQQACMEARKQRKLDMKWVFIAVLGLAEVIMAVKTFL